MFKMIGVFIALLCLSREAVAASSFAISNTLSDHVVLQRDATNPPAMVWGFNRINSTIKTTFNGKVYMSITSADGVWRQSLPSTPAGGPYTIQFEASTGESAVLRDVLFGSVYFCSGEGNMQFTVAQGNNATTEIERANAYSDIRLFAVGGRPDDHPAPQLPDITYNWSVASNATVGLGAWSAFSAACWFFGRDLHDALAAASDPTPVGLIQSAYTAAPIEAFMSRDALAACGGRGGGSIYMGMVYAFTVGPMALEGFQFYHGEQNARDGDWDYYECAFPVLIDDWRRLFNAGDTYFGFVQLANWLEGMDSRLSRNISLLRTAQLAALELPNVGYAAACDLGDFRVYYGDKQDVGLRLAAATLASVYGIGPYPCLYPQYLAAAVAPPVNGIATVMVAFAPETMPVGGLVMNPTAACYQPAKYGSYCDGFAVRFNDSAGTWVNASVAVINDNLGVELSAPVPSAGLSVVATRLGQAAWPVIAVHTAEGLPIIPWIANVTDVGPHA